MIQETLQGNWQTRIGVLAMVMFGGMGIALGQGAVNVDTPDLDKAIHAMEMQSEETGREMVGEVIPAEVDFFEVATRAVESGMEVWTLQVSLPGALAGCVYFDDFHLPVGATLHFHTPEGKYEEIWSEGPITDMENNTHRRWTNDEVPGDELVMVYRCPQGTTEPAALGICGFGFFARHQRFPHPWDAAMARGGSDPCQVDVNCPEETAGSVRKTLWSSCASPKEGASFCARVPWSTTRPAIADNSC